MAEECKGLTAVVITTELYKRAGKEARVQKQAAANQRLEDAVAALDARGATAKTKNSMSTSTLD